MKNCLAALALIAFSVPAFADEARERVYQSLRTVMPSLSKADIRTSPVEGVYEVQRGMSFFYVTSDGRYVFSGDLVDLQSGESISENARKGQRLSTMQSIGSEQMVVFPAKDEKYVVSVYTDIDCGYCRKMHREMEDYNKAGITIRYLFYPRSGPNTPSFTKAEAVWCAADRNDALTIAKNGGSVPSKSCKNPVAAHYESGQAVGVRGTPAMVMPDGGIQPGYLPADRLLAVLNGEGRG